MAFQLLGKKGKKDWGKEEKRKRQDSSDLSQLLSEQRWTSFFVDERKRGERSSFREIESLKV